MNKATLSGNIGSIRFNVINGKAVLNFRLCTTDRYTNAQGQWVGQDDWHDVAVWGKRAEALQQRMVVGQPVLVEGSIRNRVSEKNGLKVYRTQIEARSVELFARPAKRSEVPAPAEDSANEPSMEAAAQ